jgi:hypothetical protein
VIEEENGGLIFGAFSNINWECWKQRCGGMGLWETNRGGRKRMEFFFVCLWDGFVGIEDAVEMVFFFLKKKKINNLKMIILMK